MMPSALMTSSAYSISWSAPSRSGIGTYAKTPKRPGWSERIFAAWSLARRARRRCSSMPSFGMLKPPDASTDRIVVATPAWFIWSSVSSIFQFITTGVVRTFSFFHNSWTKGGNMWWCTSMRCGLVVDGLCAQTAGADKAVAAPNAPNDFRKVRRELQPQAATQPWTGALASTGSQRICGISPGTRCPSNPTSQCRRSTCGLPQLLGDARREIGEHTVGACALERDQTFRHRLLAVEPTVLRRRHDHRVLARHLIGEGRHAEVIFHAREH